MCKWPFCVFCGIPLQMRFVEGLQTKHLWLLGKKKIKMPSSHPREGTADFPPQWPSGAQGLVAPWRTPGWPGRRRRTRRRGGDAQTDWHPGRDVPPSSPSQNCRIKVSPGLSPGVVVRTERVFGRAAAPPAQTAAPVHGTCWDFPLGKMGWLGSGGCSFHLGRLGCDEPLAGSERGGGNVASLCGGRRSPASLRVSGRSLKACSVSRESRDPLETLDWASFF